jgi:DNA polymerase III subunit delta
MLYVFYGKDDYSVHSALDAVKKEQHDPNNMGTTVLDGGSVNFSEFKIACETLPFLADKRLVIAEGLLSRFEAKTRPAAKKEKEEPKDWKKFTDCIANLPPSTVLVITDGEIAKTNPLLKSLAGKGTIREFNVIKRRELTVWVQKRIAAAGSQASPAAVDLLVKLVGGDLWTMAGEIDKLALYTGGRQIQEKDVKQIVSHAQEASVFSMVDAIFEGKTSLAEELVQQMMNNGASPSYLLTMLTRQIRLAVLAKEMMAQKKHEAEIQTKLGLADFPLRKTIDQAEKYTMDQMKRFYEKLLETDISIKSGEYTDDLALNILVIELCQR